MVCGRLYLGIETVARATKTKAQRRTGTRMTTDTTREEGQFLPSFKHKHNQTATSSQLHGRHTVFGRTTTKAWMAVLASTFGEV
jgi:hypothetical protein